MKGLFLLLITICLTISCGSNTTINSCFNNTIQPITLDLNTPQLNGLQTPNGTAEITGGLNGIILFNKGTSGSFKYIAFDRQCPNKDCTTPMTISSPTMECPCDNTRYSLLNGSLISGNSNCEGGARMYTVIQNGSSIQISD